MNKLTKLLICVVAGYVGGKLVGKIKEIDNAKKEITDIKQAVGELSERIDDYEEGFCVLSEEVRKMKNKTNKE